MAGGTVSLTCSVSLPSGVMGSSVFQWERASGVINQTSSVLTISEISASDAGIYTCTVSLGGSSLPNVSTNITVQGTVV